MEKKSERMNVLTEGNGKNLIHAILNAVTKGYSDNTIVEDIIELIKSKEISKGVLVSSPDALRSYSENFAKSLNYIADEVEGFKFIDEPTVIRRKDRDDLGENDDLENEDVENDLDDTNVEVEGDVEKDEPEEESTSVSEDNVLKDDMNKEDDNVIKKELENDGDDDGEDKEDDEEEDEEEDDDDEEKSEKDIEVSEDWDKYKHEEKANKISGVLKIAFNQDMRIYKRGNKVVLKKISKNYVQEKVFDYFKNEYPMLKTELNPSILKSNIVFSDIKKGNAEVKYEIENAY